MGCESRVGQRRPPWRLVRSRTGAPLSLHLAWAVGGATAALGCHFGGDGGLPAPRLPHARRHLSPLHGQAHPIPLPPLPLLTRGVLVLETILMQDRGGQNYCVACAEVDAAASPPPGPASVALPGPVAVHEIPLQDSAPGPASLVRPPPSP